MSDNGQFHIGELVRRTRIVAIGARDAMDTASMNALFDSCIA